jgi:hypothetical protein
MRKYVFNPLSDRFDIVEQPEITAQDILDKIGNGSVIDEQYLPAYVNDVLDVNYWREDEPITEVNGKIWYKPSTAILSIWYDTDWMVLSLENGKIYLNVDSASSSYNNIFRWSGATMIQLTNRTVSIGVVGSELYASVVDSDVVGYKSLVDVSDATETQVTLTANSTSGIVWGNKYISSEFADAIAIPAKSWAFDYWRKVSTVNGISRKHLRVYLYRSGVETEMFTLQSDDINDTDFAERQISYIEPSVDILAGDRIVIQEGFSTTHGANVTLTYIVGDGRGWFMRLPLPMEHSATVNKNGKSAFQHVDTTVTKEDLDEADKVALFDSVTGKVVLSNILGDINTALETILAIEV